MTKKPGRPRVYRRKTADAICELLAAGKSLSAICRATGMPSRPTVLAWARDDFDGFFDRYTRAREIGLDVMAEQLLEISDGKPNAKADRDRLRVDTRKWYLSKLAPKRFGDRIEHSGGISLSLTQLIEASLKPKNSDEPSGS